MDERYVHRIEEGACVAAAAIIAAAAWFAVSWLTPSLVADGAAAVATLLIALLALRSIAPGEREFLISQFTPAELAFEELDELLLTEADRIDTPAVDELVLDDILANLGEDSRVVRLFDTSAMPTPGQLRARIDRHLGQTQRQTGSPDASDALHEALAELRSSLK